MEQLYQAEKQRELAFSKHVSILDGLMDTHRTRMKVFRSLYLVERKVFFSPRAFLSFI